MMQNACGWNDPDSGRTLPFACDSDARGTACSRAEMLTGALPLKVATGALFP